MINELTPHLGLPLPHPANDLDDDVFRLRDALGALDTAVAAKAEQSALLTKADLVSGTVPASQLPSYVDDVLEYANFAALPAVGEAGKIYVLLTPTTVAGITSSQFRWTGSAYAAIVSSPGSTDAVPEGATNLYFTPARAKSAVGALFSDVKITPTSNGQTSIPVPGGFTPGKIDVYLNGSLLWGGGDDYTDAGGANIVMTTGVSTADTIRVRIWNY